MNAIVFQLKRAYWASVKAGKWIVQVVEDMTPARFDIMILLRNAGLIINARGVRKPRRRHTKLNFCFMDQKRIVEELGLHKSTVSEALKRLEELGWIVRRRHHKDRRNLVVRMTELGRDRTAAACKILYRWDVMKQPIEHLVRQLEPLRPFNEAFGRVWETISAVARWFGDTSTMEFYDRQVGFELPPYTPPERRLRRMFAPGAGPRLPDFVLAFLARWEGVGRRPGGCC